MEYEKRYKIGEVSKILSVSISALRNWEKLGYFIAKRTPAGHRYYTQEQVDELLAGKERKDG